MNTNEQKHSFWADGKYIRYGNTVQGEVRNEVDAPKWTAMLNSYEPMQQLIKELDKALEDIASENYDDDCDADDLFNIIDRCKQTAREVLQSSKQL